MEWTEAAWREQGADGALTGLLTRWSLASPQPIMVLCGVRDLRDYRIHASSERAVITGGSACRVEGVRTNRKSVTSFPKIA